MLKFGLRYLCLLSCLAGSLGAASDILSLALTNHGPDLVLSWPTWANDAVLEQSPGLQPPAWSPISRALYQTNPAGFSFKASTAEESRFFRVRRLGPPVAGLTAYWRLDEASGPLTSNEAGAELPLNLTNTTFAAGRFGSGSLHFNAQSIETGGSLAWVNNANYQALPPGQSPFTLSLWFSPDSLDPVSRPILGTDATATNGWHVALNTVGPGTNELILSAALNGTSLSVTGRTLLLPGQWHRLLLTSADNQANLFLDSTLLAQASLSLTNGDGPFYFGGVPGASNGFFGRIDEIRAYTNACTAEQVSIAGEWHFEENGGPLAADQSIQGYTATITGPDAWVPGKSGSGIDLAVGSVSIANDDFRLLPPSGGPFSISAWLRPRALPTGRSGLFSCAQENNSGWQLCINTEPSGVSSIEFSSTNLGGTLRLRAPIAFVPDSWTKLDLTYNGGIATIYVNGNKLASESGAIRGCRAPFVAGAAPGATNFNGVIDDLIIYTRERADFEIGPVAPPMWEMALLNSSTNLVLQASGPPGKSLTFALISGPARGTLDFSANSPTVTYHAGAQKGPDSFVYTVSDGEFTSPPATVAVSVVQPHWLSPEGGALEPRDGSTPAQAWAAGSANVLDEIWKTNQYYDCFFYAPGEYKTTGWRFVRRSTANPGCKHIGSGSQGPGVSTIKLVNTWNAWEEGVIFGTFYSHSSADDFEVHNLVLDCNAAGNPKYALGEPVWLRIPLAATGLVNEVTLHWDNSYVAGNYRWRAAPPAEFSICTRTPGTNGYVTNCLPLTSTNRIDVVSVAANTDELLLKLSRRGTGADFYALQEIEGLAGLVSLPAATSLQGGESRLDAEHSILFAADQNPGTSWASGPEDQAQITLPLEPGATLNQIKFQWNCQTLTNLHRLGPAAQFVVSARDPETGELREVPFVAHPRSADGAQSVTFGTVDVTNTIATDQLVILLTAREAGVDSFSLKEISLQRGAIPVPMRLPSAVNTLNASYSILCAFDGDVKTRWASGVQGGISAINVRGSNLKFTGLKVINFGTKPGIECFPLAVFAQEPSATIPPLRNILVQDCLFTQPATNNNDGLTAVAVAGPGAHSMSNAIVRRCAVIGVASQFTYSQAFVATFVENCLVDDCRIGVYFEPTTNKAGGFDSVGPVVIRSNRFYNVRAGVNVTFHPGSHFESLSCIGNEFVLSEWTSGHAVGACDTCYEGIPGTITNVTALNNLVRYPNWRTWAAAPEQGFLSGDIQNAVYANNIVALGTSSPLALRPYPTGSIPAPSTPEDCDHPGLVVPGPNSIPPSLDLLPPGYRRAWYNNRDLSGALLPVRQRVSGVIQPASQQQWPE